MQYVANLVAVFRVLHVWLPVVYRDGSSASNYQTIIRRWRSNALKLLPLNWGYSK